MKVIEDAVVELIRTAEVRLPEDVRDAIHRAFQREKSEVGKLQLKNILSNIELAEKKRTPICQDTGLLSFHVKVGREFNLSAEIGQALRNAVEKATMEIPLRPNVVHPLSRRSTGTNVGVAVPHVNYVPIPGDFVELTVLVKGAGCENMSSLGMLSPGADESSLKRLVVNTVIKAGGAPCPPTVLGVGIGGSASQVMNLAERALLRPLGQPHPERAVAELEEALLKAVNLTGIGPMGLGGNVTVLAVQVELAHTHTACLPVGINLACWCLRRASVRIHKDGTKVPLG